MSTGDDLRTYLRQLRRRHPNLTQAELAKRLNSYLDEDDHVTPQAISNWETGRNTPSRRSQRALELVFELPAGTIAAIADPMDTTPFTGSPAAREGSWDALRNAQAEVARLGYELQEAVQRMRDAAGRLETETVIADADAALAEVDQAARQHGRHSAEADSPDGDEVEPVGDAERPADGGVSDDDAS